MARHLGVDLDRNRFTVCMRCENARTYFKTVELKHLKQFAASVRPDDEIAVEMTTNTSLLVNAVIDVAKRVVVVDSAKFKVISESTKKTDNNEAELLAFFLAKDMLPEIRMKDK